MAASLVLDPHAPLGPQRAAQHRVHRGRKGRLERRDSSALSAASSVADGEEALEVRVLVHPAARPRPVDDGLERRPARLQADAPARRRRARPPPRESCSAGSPQNAARSPTRATNARRFWRQRLVERADRVVVHGHRRQPRPVGCRADTGARARSPAPSGSFESVGPLQVDEVLQHASLNGASLTTTPAGSVPGSSGKLPRPKRGAPPSAAVMFQTAVRCAHLLDGHVEDGAAPARDGLGLVRGQPLGFAAAQAEGRVQVGAHQVVLELGGFVQLVYERLAGNAGLGHDCVSVLTHRRTGKSS